MKISHIVPDISKEANGVAPVVESLALNSHSTACSVTIAAIAVRKQYPGIEYFVAGRPFALNHTDISPRLLWRTFELLGTNDVIHNHGLWSFINVTLGMLPRRGKTKIVVSPHGTLSAWSLNNKKLKKKIFWPLQKLLLSRADLIHVTSDEEFHEVRSLGFTNPIAVIANGVNDDGARRDATRSERRSVLFLSRIHPKKGLENLISAWAAVENENSDWDLVIAGVGESSYTNSLSKMVADMKLEHVQFPGPIYGLEKIDAYKNADLFILPTYSENFGMVIAEALMSECPAIVGKGAPWSQLESNGCGWWISNDVETITKTLQEAMLLDDLQRKSMGKRGREWMCRDYGWPSITEKMVASYEWLIDGGKAPAWIRLSKNVDK